MIDTAAAVMYAPRLIGWDDLHGARLAVVQAPCGMSRDRPEILGAVVAIDGALWRVEGVERYMLGTPIRAGEKIALRVTRADQQGLSLD